MTLHGLLNLLIFVRLSSLKDVAFGQLDAEYSSWNQEAGDLVALFPADDDKKLQTSWLLSLVEGIRKRRL